MYDNNVYNGLLDNYQNPLSRDSVQLIAAIDNTIEAQRLTRTLFRSFDYYTECTNNKEVVELILARIQEAIRHIERFILNSTETNFQCSECSLFIDIEVALSILRRLYNEICELANNYYPKCALIEIEERIERIDYVVVIVYLIRVLKSIEDDN